MANYISSLTGAQMDIALSEMAAYNSEAWAVGTRNGEPVTSGDPVYENNSKYWAQQAAADSSNTSGYLQTHFSVPRIPQSDSGLYSITSGGISNTGADASNSARARTQNYTWISQRPVRLQMDDDTYEFYRVWTYSAANQSSGVRKVLGEAVPGSNSVYIFPEANENCFRVSFALTADDTQTLTQTDYDAIASKFHVYTDTDKSLTLTGTAADAKVTGDEIRDLYDRTSYPIDTSGFYWGYGGMTKTGEITDDNTRLRFRKPNGLGAVAVLAGSTVSIANGYKFGVVLFEYYSSTTNNKVIGFRAMEGGTWTVPYDCYIRVFIGTNNDDILWTEDSSGVKTVTAAGEAATEALTLNLLGGTIKEHIDNLENAALEQGIRILPLDAIPNNAVDYHALWDDIVGTGLVTRELLGKVNSSDDYPVYLYKIERDKGYIASNYDIIPWDGTNEVYTRPKILLTAGIHGNERTMPLAAFDFANNLINDVSYQKMCDAFDWYIIPLLNPWGFSHYAVSKSTGTVNNGNGYTSSTIEDYNVFENNNTTHQGIRRNAAGIDINRDFTSFSTQEAQFVRDAINSITNNGAIQFCFSIDGHQATGGSTVNAIGAYCSVGYSAPTDVKTFIFSKWMQVGGETEKLAIDTYDGNIQQSVYPWVGANISTSVRAFCEGYTTYPMVMEGGQNCVFISNSTTWSNSVARAFVNTQYQGFLKKLTSHWM